MELPATTEEITVEWLNEVLHENGFLGTANIVSLKQERLGTGVGFLSNIARLKLKYGQDGSALPSTIIAKLPPPPRPGTPGLAKINFEREIGFYRNIAPDSPIRTPHIIYAAADSENQKYNILMEDCSVYSEIDPSNQGLDFDEVSTIAINMADFHSKWWDYQQPSGFTWLTTLNDSFVKSMYVNAFNAIWETNVQKDDFRDSLPAGGWEAGLKIHQNRPLIHEQTPLDRLTINHGDLRSNNIFFDPNNRQEPFIYFDWGMTYKGRGPYDISYLMGLSVSTDLRRKEEKNILALYHDCLMKNGITDYSFDECYNDYLLGLLFNTIVPLNLFRSSEHVADKSFPLSALQRMFSAVVENEATRLLP